MISSCHILFVFNKKMRHTKKRESMARNLMIKGSIHQEDVTIIYIHLKKSTKILETETDRIRGRNKTIQQ